MNSKVVKGKRLRSPEMQEISGDDVPRVRRERLSPALTGEPGPSRSRAGQSAVTAPSVAVAHEVSFSVRGTMVTMHRDDLPQAVLKFMLKQPRMVLDIDFRQFNRLLDFYRDKKLSPRISDKDLRALKSIAKYLNDATLLAEIKEVLPLRKAAHASKGTIQYPGHLEALADRLEALGDTQSAQKKRDRAKSYGGHEPQPAAAPLPRMREPEELRNVVRRQAPQGVGQGLESPEQAMQQRFEDSLAAQRLRQAAVPFVELRTSNSHQDNQSLEMMRRGQAAQTGLNTNTSSGSQLPMHGPARQQQVNINQQGRAPSYDAAQSGRENQSAPVAQSYVRTPPRPEPSHSKK